MRNPLSRARRGFVMACVGAASLAMGCTEPNETPNGEDVALSDEEQASFPPPEQLRVGESEEEASPPLALTDAEPTPQSRADIAFDEDDAWMAKGLVRTALPHAKIYNWVANSAETVMDPVSTHVCFLTRVSGNFDGGSAIALHRNAQTYNQAYGVTDNNSPNWKLAGFQNHANSLIGEATCVPRADFKVNPGGFTQVSTAGWIILNGCPQSHSINMWPGNSISYIGWVRGKFEGGGESVEIIQSFSENTSSKLKVSTEQCARTEGGAYSFSAGIPKHANHPSFLHSEPPFLAWFPNSTESPYGGNEMKLSAKSDTTKRQRLVKTKDAVCYLTRISGEFNGGGERLRIYPEKDASGTEWWWFEAKAEGGRAYGNARCILYDQRMTEVTVF